MPGGEPVATAVTFTTSEVASPSAATFYTQSLATGGSVVGATVDLSARFGVSDGVQAKGWQARARVGYPSSVPRATDTFCATPHAVEAFVQESDVLLGDAQAQNALQLPWALRDLAVAKNR